jgi:glycerol uptake facilitator-like aquaporin
VRCSGGQINCCVTLGLVIAGALPWQQATPPRRRLKPDGHVPPVHAAATAARRRRSDDSLCTASCTYSFDRPQGAANFVAQMLGSVAGAVLLLLATRVRLLCAAYSPIAL